MLANRLELVTAKIISDNQRGFIKGHQISDCICTASECINLLDKRAFAGQLAKKIDIRKAFDTFSSASTIALVLMTCLACGL